MFKVPNNYRLTEEGNFMSSTPRDGNNGVFIIPHYKIPAYVFYCIASDGEGWEHISVTLRKEDQKKGKFLKGQNRRIINHRVVGVERCPTWEEMCFIKDQFWSEDECVMQLHPPKEAHVNNHSFCLHLWKPLKEVIPQPNPLFVGIKGLENNKILSNG